ncbi:restriction endonuclease subunit S [Nitrosomonas sp.]|uniref:restriction endonuclease subunit S n=1 Tax=Nitrosomonas sp. TaxID=42353 RepID=UPI0025F7E60E|nr:restriction endonuclease subunit S [Nitrosomonas sp.]MCC6916401.1 restriction endonuclease subunit S [Nitrosomonas sp.]
MASEWPIVRIEDIADKIAMGPFGSNIKVETFVETGVPVISGAHLRGVRVEDRDFNFVTEEHAEKMRNSNVFRGDVIFTHAGNISQVAYIPPNSQYERYVISQRQFYLRCDLSKADPVFISYFFHSNEGRHKLLANASQTGVPSIARPSSYLKTIELPLPPLEEQGAIAETLGVLDDRIDNLHQTNATLEAIAAALFKSRFVDFDGVLPEDMQELELDLIPKGWRVGTLADLCELNAAKWTDKKHPPTVRYIDLSGVSSNRIEAITEYAFDEAPSRARMHLREGDTIVGTVRPGNRAFAYIHMPDASLTGSTGFAVLSPRKPHYASFIYLAITRNEAIERLANLADGAAYPAVRPNVVAETPCVVAPDQVIAEFSAVTKPMLERIERNSQQAATLATLRDTLLPRLISGRLRVSDAEAAI